MGGSGGVAIRYSSGPRYGKTGARAPYDACLPLANVIRIPGTPSAEHARSETAKGSTGSVGLARPAVDRPVDDRRDPVENWWTAPARVGDALWTDPRGGAVEAA